MSNNTKVYTEAQQHLMALLSHATRVYIKGMGQTEAGYHKFLVFILTSKESRLVDITAQVAKALGSRWRADGTLSGYYPGGVRSLGGLIREYSANQDYLEVAEV